MISRRLFLGVLLAGAAAPAIVRASSLMPIKAPKLWVPEMEIGVYQGFRFVESRELALMTLTAEYIRYMALQADKACGIPAPGTGGYLAFVHSPSVIEEMLRKPFRRP